MCLIVLAWRQHPDFPLVLAANRDESFLRPSAAAAFWPREPHILAGRDLQAGGTWLGVTRGGRFAALSNVREAAAAGGPSRGRLVSAFLRGTASPADYLAGVARHGMQFAGFNLLAGDGCQLGYCSNRDGAVRLLAPGIYGLSNHLLDTPWSKVQRAKDLLAPLLTRPEPRPEDFWALLSDRWQPPEQQLPKTGLDGERERRFSSIFVPGGDYGTRCSTVLLMGRAGRVRFVERRFDAQGNCAGEARYVFDLQPRQGE